MSWNGAGRGGWFSCLAHCWVLRQQGRGPRVLPSGGVRGGGFGVSGFLAAFARACMAVPLSFCGGGGWCGGCGTGLLFENYIVDASI